ncbi:unnamed protein product [Cuscuta campestris]|uniref:CRAL-TRIO domain-containing protein n=1 Tax=Cuscuta campestris TaxID=132261 RepID=A0A484MDR2_9ASTE|nr:unnamed protein product [Cuscuta campestris]
MHTSLRCLSDQKSIFDLTTNNVTTMLEKRVFLIPSFDNEDDTSSSNSIAISDDDLDVGPESSPYDARTTLSCPNAEGREETKLSVKMALLDLRCRVEDAILSKYLVYNKKKAVFSKADVENQRDISLWGVPLLPSRGHEGTDVILAKFLKSRDFKAAEAFKALQKALRWRTKHRVRDILGDKNIVPEGDSLLHADGKDKDGRPVCYQTLGNFKDLNQDVWGTSHEERRDSLTRWRIQCLKKGIRLLDFKPGGPNSIILVTDLRNSPGIAMKEVRWITKNLLRLLHDNYPGLIYKNVIKHLNCS